jgi:hypothetical protein
MLKKILRRRRKLDPNESELKTDGFVKSPEDPKVVIPVETGIQCF